MPVFKIFKTMPAGLCSSHGSLHVFQQNMAFFQPCQHFIRHKHTPPARFRLFLPLPLKQQTAAQSSPVGTAGRQARAFLFAIPPGATGHKQIKQMPAFLAASRQPVAAHDA